MTTVICTRDLMVSDRRACSPIMQTQKIFRVGDSIFGVSGKISQCLRFIEWKRDGGDPPEYFEEGDVEVLELTAAGAIYWYGDWLVPVVVREEYFAIGTGAPFALGAMRAGATVERAIEIAALYDESTGPEFDVFVRGRE